jgi:hypothetical protein
VAWEGYDEIFGARLGADGTVLDPAAITFAPLVASRTETRPAVAWNGERFLVVWEEWELLDSVGESRVLGRRMAPDGTLLDSPPIVVSVSPAAQAPSVAAAGSTFLVVWDQRMAANHYEIRGGRVAATGELLDPDGLTISSSPFPERAPAVSTAGGARWVVTYDGFDATPGVGSQRVFARGIGPDPSPPASEPSGGCGTPGAGGGSLGAILLLLLASRISTSPRSPSTRRR